MLQPDNLTSGNDMERLLLESKDPKPDRPYIPFIPALLGKTHKPEAAGSVQAALPPADEKCEELWNKYEMPTHIRAHSAQVAMIVCKLWEMGQYCKVNTDRATLKAGALLHDIGKIYTINYNGDHAQLGAGIILRETKNHAIAQMIYHHVWWPWAIDVENHNFLPSLFLLYADKRVRHDLIVNIEERYIDLLDRYGHTEKHKASIRQSYMQGKEIEQALSKKLKVNLNEYTFDSGRLVQ